jgi:hypothetical protein
MLALVVIAVAVLALAAGWFAHAAYRAFVIASHTRCMLCNGEGCVNDVTTEYLADRDARLEQRTP